jgi:ribosome biogenesis GTPase
MSQSSGLVVERHRRHVVVEDDHMRRISCKSRKRSLGALVGDRVAWQLEADGTGIVNEVLPRDSLLNRIDSRGKPEPVAANLSQLIIVAAAAPPPDWSLLDRYLVGAETLRLKALIVFNKTDLSTNRPEALQTYRNIGYGVCTTSAKNGASLADLEKAMVGERSAMVGQSGVGKSSLINALLGETRQSVGALTEKGQQGRHTTTSTTLNRLSSGAELIDSPGVRSYAPYLEDDRNLDYGFKEFQALLGHCRFDNCRHLAEPGCAIKIACKDGRVDARRYESYTALLSTLSQLRERTLP